MRRLVLGLVLVGLAAAPASAQQRSEVWGAGAVSCANFAEAYRDDPSTIETFYFSWAQGYLSGMNVGRSALQMKAVDLGPPEFYVDQQQAFIRRFCADNPLKDYRDAVNELGTKLRDIDR